VQLRLAPVQLWLTSVPTAGLMSGIPGWPPQWHRSFVLGGDADPVPIMAVLATLPRSSLRPRAQERRGT